MRTFVIGDIHGSYKAMMQCFERADFDAQVDRLICLGDVCDRGTEIRKVFDVLCSISKLEYILGNHDYWALEWIKSGKIHDAWIFQGGRATIKDYPDGMPDSHKILLDNAHNYFLDKQRLFVHGGILTHIPLENQDQDVFLWDRSLVQEAMKRVSNHTISPITKFEEIYVGHTPTINFNSKLPIPACEVWLMDTGAGWGGPLSMMNIDTKEIFQSEDTRMLYA
ncbi:MAG: metallophosphoesterase [Bacteroidota bacterium]|nr:metallophosphoesterase [Bacteroidota bacterium]